MITFSVPKDLLLYSHEMGTPSDFSVRGFSGGQSEDGSSMTFRTTAAPPPPPTVVADDIGATDAATATSGNVLTNDDPGLSVVAVNGLSGNVGVSTPGSNGGLFTIAANGAWTFDPGGDFASLTGSDTATTSVTYHASDGVGEAMATLTVAVSAAVPTDDPLWDSVVLCINADAGIIDAKGHPLSVVGGVTVSTTLGYQTLLFNGSGGYLTSPDSEDWFYGSGPLTIEAWVQPLSSTYVMILSQLASTSSNNNRFLVGGVDGVLSVFCSTTTTTIDSQVTATFSTGSMQYYAVKFVDGYVSHWLNGVMQGSPVATPGSVHDISGLLYIGAMRYAGAMRYLNGHMRGLRITRANRDVSAVPTYPFPTS